MAFVGTAARADTSGGEGGYRISLPIRSRRIGPWGVSEGEVCSEFKGGKARHTNMEVLTLAAKLLLARPGGAVGRWEWLGSRPWAVGGGHPGCCLLPVLLPTPSCGDGARAEERCPRGRGFEGRAVLSWSLLWIRRLPKSQLSFSLLLLDSFPPSRSEGALASWMLSVCLLQSNARRPSSCC